MSDKAQVVRGVREIEALKQDIEDHWTKILQAITDNRVDNAIPLLKAYFRLKQKLVSVEAQLEGFLSAYFSGM
jgi:tRNA U54 and U55 pseudouridine synthase Pus10